MELRLEAVGDNGRARRHIAVADLAAASRAAQIIRDELSVSGSGWRRADLYEGRRWVGHVSYNGRVWDVRPGAWRPSDRPLLEAQPYPSPSPAIYDDVSGKVVVPSALP